MKITRTAPTMIHRLLSPSVVLALFSLVLMSIDGSSAQAPAVDVTTSAVAIDPTTAAAPHHPFHMCLPVWIGGTASERRCPCLGSRHRKEVLLPRRRKSVNEPLPESECSLSAAPGDEQAGGASVQVSGGGRGGGGAVTHHRGWHRSPAVCPAPRACGRCDPSTRSDPRRVPRSSPGGRSAHWRRRSRFQP